ncbi:MAG: hypothetical protein AAGA55_10805 [Planctomycetota bacterium]
MNSSRPFRDDEAPGRIPDSLIDAVLDGAVDDRTRREVHRALRHDVTRRQDVHETIEAIQALRAPLDCPDVSAEVLSTLDRSHRFLCTNARRALRRTRMGLGLAAILALGVVAVGQRAIPRLASIAPPPTPVSDVAKAFRSDAGRAADDVMDSARVVRASITRLPALKEAPTQRSEPLPFDMPGQRFRFEVDARSVGGSLAGVDLSGYRMVTLDGGRILLLDAGTEIRPRAMWPSGPGSISLLSASYGTASGPSARASTDRPEPDQQTRGGWIDEDLP